MAECMKEEDYKHIANFLLQTPGECVHDEWPEIPELRDFPDLSQQLFKLQWKHVRDP